MGYPSRMQQRLLIPRSQRTGRAWAGSRPMVPNAAPPNQAEVEAAIERGNLKGKQGGNCNVTACQRPGAWFLNSGTRAYYCFSCAADIRKFNKPEEDGFTLFEQWDEDLARYNAAMEKLFGARRAAK